MRFGSKKSTGSGIADRREQQPLRVVRVRRADDLEAGDVDEERLGRLRVVEAAADAAADGRAHDHLGRVLAARAPAELRQLADDLVVRRVDEVRELDLRDRHEAVERHADRGADDAALGERRVDDAVVAELVPEALGDAEDAADLAHVLAEHDDAIVAPHLVAEGVVDRLDHVHLGHVAAPATAARAASRCSRRCQGALAYTSSNSVSTPGRRSLDGLGESPLDVGAHLGDEELLALGARQAPRLEVAGACARSDRAPTMTRRIRCLGAAR